MGVLVLFRGVLIEKVFRHLKFIPKGEYCILDKFALTELLRYCYEDDCTKEDPLSQESFRKLAVPLPYSKQHHSKLVCYITKELMDTENPPQVLPNGYVYSAKVSIILVVNCSENVAKFVFFRTPKCSARVRYRCLAGSGKNGQGKQW